MRPVSTLTAACTSTPDPQVELVPNSKRVDVHITFDDDSGVPTETMTGTAILVLDDKRRTPLVPATAGKLSGDIWVTVPEAVKGAVQLTDPEGKTVQAKV